MGQQWPAQRSTALGKVCGRDVATTALQVSEFEATPQPQQLLSTAGWAGRGGSTAAARACSD